MRDRDLDFSIARLGECRVRSPMSHARFTRDHERVLHHTGLEDVKAWLDRGKEPPAMELAGPRERLFFDPSRLACGIVTCGGICPGLNDVIRSIVLSLHHHYGVDKVYGFRFGYEGLVRRYGHKPLELTPDAVMRIHEIGGSVLGSSRGPQDPAEMVDTLEDLKVGILFAIGGDGTLRGAQAISDEARRRGLAISVIGIPKTIDNDISFVQETFGFETAVAEARRATHAANSEAEAARNGIGLVKLMGRDSGFIAAFSVLVDSQVNFCLVPEVPFSLERFLSELEAADRTQGPRGDRRGRRSRPGPHGSDPGTRCIGQPQVRRHRRLPAGPGQGALQADRRGDQPQVHRSQLFDQERAGNPHDSAFCLLLGHCAVHAGMSGRTNMVVSFWNSQFTHVPISLAVSERKKIDPEGPLWSVVLASTGQPRDLHGPAGAAGRPPAEPVRNP